tara:strand:- start:130 stop:675 length:546 start_codon:yes stop_codon:yes gene_type:complete
LAKSRGVDLFTSGSGNPGATNVKRTMGDFWGNTVFILDFLKGYVVILIAQELSNLYQSDLDWLFVIALIGVILGHNFSLFLKFRGGKGVATTMGGMAGFMFPVLAVGLIIWLVTFFMTRFVALASIFFALSLPVSAYFFYAEGSWILRVIVSIIIAILIVVRHFSNIKRLLRGEEHCFYKK